MRLERSNVFPIAASPRHARLSKALRSPGDRCTFARQMPRLGRLTSVSVKLQLPYVGGVEGTWQPDEREREAAWEMYVELVTRIAVVELRPGEGLVREALTSLYSLFETTRAILRKYGPVVAKPKGEGDLSFGSLAVIILNGVLRPLLARWHPLLQEHEARRPEGVSARAHERAWEHERELREELGRVREALVDYANVLAEVAGVEPLRWPEPAR